MQQVVAISGSLRKDSYNSALLRAAQALAPPALRLDPHSIHEIPLYNGDVEAAGIPSPVTLLRDAIRAADGVLILTPEYNHGMPGVVKNLVDWLSRGPKPQAFDDKPVAIGGITPGGFGTRSSQQQLRQCLTALNAVVMPQPSLQVPGAQERFDASLNLTDARTRASLEKFLVAFSAWIARVGGKGA